MKTPLRAAKPDPRPLIWLVTKWLSFFIITALVTLQFMNLSLKHLRSSHKRKRQTPDKNRIGKKFLMFIKNSET